jgi:hypothetical protein
MLWGGCERNQKRLLANAQAGSRFAFVGKRTGMPERMKCMDQQEGH